jgi:succinate-acetate transporter protein
MGAYLLLWGIFTLGMFIGTIKLNRALQFVFGSLAILFFLLALARFTGNPVISIIAGYEGVICGFSAVYTSFALLLNEVYGRKIVPL